MSILRTYPVGGLALLVVFALLAKGCGEEPATVNWQAGDAAAHYYGG